MAAVPAILDHRRSIRQLHRYPEQVDVRVQCLLSGDNARQSLLSEQLQN
jgi:hypothetical protein